jgi:hypothetical protein
MRLLIVANVKAEVFHRRVITGVVDTGVQTPPVLAVDEVPKFYY